MPTPSIGRIVHYTSYGTPHGEFESECRAAVITAVNSPVEVDLAVLNPTGLYFNQRVSLYDVQVNAPGTWHWPERVDD